MKLDFQTNASNFSSVAQEFYNDTSIENSSPEALPMLNAGIKAAQDGNRAEAKALLLSVTETEPGNEEAWMWLASVSEYPEELLGFLNHVLEINPANERALEWSKSTKALLSKNLVERGMSASKDDHKDFAKQCFLKAIAQDGENETAWLWLASVSDSAEEKTAYLQKVLSLNPENENAIFLLKSIKNKNVDTLLQKAVAVAVADERKAAKKIIEKVLNDAPELIEAWVLKSFLVESFEEKLECFEKILDLDDENELANVNWTALLDIMSKAESPTRIESAKQFSAAKNADFEEPETLSDSPAALFENIEHQTVAPDGNLQEFQTDFLTPATEEEIVEESGTSEKIELRAENENDFSDSAQEAASEEFESFEAPEKPEIDYPQPQTEFSQEISTDYSSNTTGEIQIPTDNLPSYYENEDAVTDRLPSLETIYPQEPADSEPNNFADDDLENKDSRVEPDSVVDEQTINEENSGEANFSEANFFEENLNELPSEPDNCPFCDAEGESQSLVCNSCHTVLTLSDLEMIIAHQDTDLDILRQAVERMEDERNQRDFSVEEIKLLAIGQINLKNLRQGCAYLEEAAQTNPNDVFLGSQVNFLKIRLAEIEEQQSIHDSMPKNRKILVVDDSATVRKLISGKLEKSGHEVFCAVDGIDALEKIKEFVPDLILLDINMPRMDGYQVCKLIRGDEATKDVPIVMISGKDGFFDKVRGRMAGTTGYITKPFGPETLMKMLETYIV